MGSFRTIKKLLQLTVMTLPITSLLISAVPVSALVSNPAPAAKVSFTFDDGLASAVTQAAPALAASGLTGTDYIITGCVGMITVPNTCAANTGAKYMSWAQVTQLKSTYGWDIGGHSVTHPQLATDKLTDAQLTNEVAGSKQTLADHGFTATDFATPYGDYDNRVLAEIAKNYASHRGFADVSNNVWSYNDYLLNDMQVQGGVTVAQVEARVDQAIANNYWLVLTFHDIKTNPSVDPQDYEYKTSDLAAIAAYVKTKQDANLLKSVNINSGLVASDTNLLTNGSFTNGLNGGWSTDTPTNVVLDTGNHGSYPAPQNSVAFTAGTTGDAHLFSPKVAVDSSQTYMVKGFLNLAARTSGELGYYIDEYDASGNWVSGQWKLAETVPFVKEENFTYKPTSPNVKKASVQIYATANSGITAYVDNLQMFSLQDTATPPPPSTNNLLPNSEFADGIADGWTTSNATAYAADNANHGGPDSPAQSVKLTAGATNTYLFAPQVGVDSLNTYTVNAYTNITTLSSGELAFYIDEYDASGNWVSGQYAYAKRNASAETISFSYVPTSANVKKAGLQVILVGNSGITGYLDNVQVLGPGTPTTPPPPPPVTPPAGPNLMTNGTFDTGIADGWTTDDPANITADNANHGGPANAVNSVKLVGSTLNRHLFSPQIGVDPTKTYTLTSYLDLQQITSGEVAFYIDEYDASGNWVSGQYRKGVTATSTGDVSFSYTPTSSTVSKASLQVIVVANSGISAYLDDIRFVQN